MSETIIIVGGKFTYSIQVNVFCQRSRLVSSLAPLAAAGHKVHQWHQIHLELSKKKIHYITSRKGHKLLVFQQYPFAKNNDSKQGALWSCSSRCSKQCKAQVYLNKDGTLNVINPIHTHEAPVFYINQYGNYVRIYK